MSTLHVFDSGDGPPVVLLHGMPSAPSDFEGVAAELPGFRVLVPHLAGYGETPAARGKHGMTASLDALAAALEKRNVLKPTLVGYSMGGYRAIALARRLEAR